jgi:hypothetical protein
MMFWARRGDKPIIFTPPLNAFFSRRIVWNGIVMSCLHLKLLISSFLFISLFIACAAGCSRTVVKEDNDQLQEAASEQLEPEFAEDFGETEPEADETATIPVVKKPPKPKKPFVPVGEKPYPKRKKAKTAPVVKKAVEKKPPEKVEKEQDFARHEIPDEIKRPGKGVPWSKRHIFQTAHFEVHSNLSKKATEEYARIVEALYAKYRMVFAALNPERRRGRVFIWSSEIEFRNAWDINENVRGFYRRADRSLNCYHDVEGDNWKTLEVLQRQLCYYFLELIVKSRIFPTDVKIIESREGYIEFEYKVVVIESSSVAFSQWLREGLAIVLEGFVITKDCKVKLTGLRPKRLKALKSDMEKGKHISVPVLLTSKPKEWSWRHDNTAGSFVWWLLKGSKKKKYNVVFDKYLRKCIEEARESSESGSKKKKPVKSARRIESFKKILKEVAGKKIWDIDKEWTEYVLKMKLPEGRKKTRKEK